MEPSSTRHHPPSQDSRHTKHGGFESARPGTHRTPQHGTTPLHEAAMMGRSEAVAELLAARADLHAKDVSRVVERAGGCSHARG
jgi:hypothetical protein